MSKKIKRFVVLNFIATIVAFQLVALMNYWYFVYKNFSSAAINDTIAYQGKVIDGAGIPIADGDYNMRFRVYAADCAATPCADDANYVWEEYWDGTTRSGNQTLSDQVTVTNGIFNVELNSLCQSWTGACAQSGGVDFNTSSLYLQVELDADGNSAYEELFVPRKRFSSSAYAMNADRVDGKDIGTSGNTIPLLDTANTWSALQTITPASATDKAFIVQGVESQSANLVEFQTSSGSVVTSIDANGYLRTSNLYTSTITAGNTSGSTAGNGPSTESAGLVSYWRMDDNNINPIDDDAALELWLKTDEGSGTTLTDSSTNALSGTVVNATWAGTTPFATGNALTFDGNGDYAEVADTAAVDLTSDYSVGLWMKTATNFSTNAILAAKYNDGINDGWMIRQNASEQIEFVHRRSGSGSIITSSSTYSDNAWHYVMATFEVGVGTRLYIDGFLVGTSTAVTGALADTSLNVRFGAQDYASAPRYWTGSLANPVMYSRTLSSDEIMRQYRASQATYVADIVGTNHGLIANALFAGAGAFGYTDDDALTFDGAGDYVDAPGAVLTTSANTAQSAFAWVKSSNTTDNMAVFAQYINNSDPGRFMLTMTSTGEIEYFQGGTTIQTTGAAVNDGEWHLVGFTRSTAGAVTVYVDGASAATGTANTGYYNGTFTIGANGSDANNDFTGTIDAVLVYDTELSAADVSALQESGLPTSTGVIIDTASEYTGADSKLLSVRNNGTEKASINKDGVIDAAGVTTAEITATGQLLIDLASNTQGLIIQGASSQGVNLLELQSSAGTVLSSFNSSGVLNTENIVTGQITSDAAVTSSAPTTADANIMSYWKMDDDRLAPDVAQNDAALVGYLFTEGTGTSLDDATNNNNDATITGAVWGSETPFASGNSLHFDTSTDYARVDTIDIGKTQQSGALEFWFKTATATTGTTVATYSSSGSDVELMMFGYALGGSWAPAGNSRLYLRSYKVNNDANDNQILGSTSLSDNTWYHVVFASTGSGYRIYLNGVEETLTVYRGSNDGDWFADLSGAINHYMHLGRGVRQSGQIGSAYGHIAYFSMLDAVPSADEIMRRYRQSQSTFIADYVGNNHGAVSGGSWVGGAFGYTGDYALDLEASSNTDYVTVYLNTTLPAELQTLSDAISFQAWVTPESVTGAAPSYWIQNYTITELRRNTGAGAHVPFSFGITNSKLSLGVADNHAASSQKVYSNTTLVEGVEYHVGFTIDGDNWTLYINGEVDASGTFTVTGDRSVGSGASSLMLGARTSDGGAVGTDFDFDGIIDNAILYNDVLTSAEVASQYAAATGGGIANVFDTTNAFTASDATLLSLRTAGVEKLAIGLDLITFRGDANKTMQVGRTAAADTAGYDLTIAAGGAVSGGTDLAGGDLYLASGISTGTGGSDIYIQTPTPGSTGTTDNTLVTQLKIGSDGRVYIGDGVSTTTPRLLVLGIKSDAGDPTGTNGAIYYNENDHKFRCYQNSAWTDCITASSSNGYTAVTTSTYSIQTSDGIVGVNYAGSVVLTLPAPSVNDTVIIKDESGDASNSNIVISQNGSETVDGGTSVSITTNYGSVRLYSDGTNWYTY